MKNLSEAKVGDILYISSGRSTSFVDTVAKVGKVHITTSRGTKFLIRTGRRSGDRSAWHYANAKVMTDEEIKSHKEGQKRLGLCDLITGADWKSQTTETLEAVLALIK